ncbi:MAG TPA: sterol desaturase family protein [Sulfurospirillum arcachonense]|nr:sterol desaturase family protein [Sulfurospirillum arcachonense]HIP45650.1 sterol desaturase family protein [Sulfurospirillum arcachonense]
MKILFPFLAIGASIFAKEQGVGVFNILNISPIYSILFSIILLDLIIYWQHRLFHKVDFLWKFHKVHHSDMDYDVTTALRFHPIEIIMLYLCNFKVTFFTYRLKSALPSF